MINLVYVYKENTSILGSDLKYALRSLVNFKEDFNIYLAGEIPDWVNREEIYCIDIEQNYDRPSQYNQYLNYTRVLDVIKGNEIFVMDDDMIFIKDTWTKDIKKASIKSYIPDFSKLNIDTTKESIFTQRIIYTWYLLNSIGDYPNVTLTSHTPRYYEVDKLKALIKKFPQKSNLNKFSPQVYILENLYHLYYGEELNPDCSKRAGYYKDEYEPITSKTHILNFDEDGLITHPQITKYIKETFSKKSKYEK